MKKLGACLLCKFCGVFSIFFWNLSKSMKSIVVNSVIMNHVTIGDGCSIQGSVISSNVQLQERAVLKDCQIGAGFVVTAGSEYKGESLARK
ncbi:hypothetical protein L1887_06845 [Cichorium endivia]|nr:hypothetical protein L1887_06845 [Cichorium endivia]